MGRVVTASGGGVRPMWRRDARGELVLIEEPDLNEYVTPPRGTRGRFTLSGISEKFEMNSEQYGKSENVELEFRIDKTTNKDFKWAEGMRFLQLVTLKTGPKSNFGQLLGTLRGTPTATGEDIDIDAYIDTSFISSTTLVETSSGRQRAGISTEAIEAGSVKLSPHLNGTGPHAAEPVAASVTGATDIDDDPFAEEGLL